MIQTKGEMQAGQRKETDRQGKSGIVTTHKTFTIPTYITHANQRRTVSNLYAKLYSSSKPHSMGLVMVFAPTSTEPSTFPLLQVHSHLNPSYSSIKTQGASHWLCPFSGMLFSQNLLG